MITGATIIGLMILAGILKTQKSKFFTTYVTFLEIVSTAGALGYIAFAHLEPYERIFAGMIFVLVWVKNMKNY